MKSLFVVLAILTLFRICIAVYEWVFPSPIYSRDISDEEFLAAVPRSDPAIALRVREIVSEQLDIPRNCLHPDDRFVEDLKAD